MTYKGNKINIVYLLYLVLLLLILVSWRDTESAPPFIRRVVFMFAALVPAYLSFRKTLIPILACFTTISYYGYAHTYFPAEMEFLIPILLFLAILKKNKEGILNSGNKLLLILSFYTGIIDLLCQGTLSPISSSFLVLYLVGLLIDNDDQSVVFLGYALCVSSITLSLEFFFVGDEMVRDYAGLGFSRVFLRDPNYYGAIIGCGAVVALREFLNPRDKKLIEKILYTSCFSLSFFVIILNASRGAMLSVSLCFAFLIAFRPIKMKYKIIIVAASVIAVIVLYQNGYFDLLQYRVETDSGTGSDRTVIWSTKLNSFANDFNFFNILCGVGYENALSIGRAGFHNDFIAMLVEYGIVGLLLLLYLLLRPLQQSSKTIFVDVLAMVIFLLFSSMTIEPITAGRYSNLLLLIYIEKTILRDKIPCVGVR